MCVPNRIFDDHTCSENYANGKLIETLVFYEVIFIFILSILNGKAGVANKCRIHTSVPPCKLSSCPVSYDGSCGQSAPGQHNI